MALVLGLVTHLVSRAGQEAASARALAPAAAGQSRQYAPDREADLVHLALDVTPDFDSRTLRGEATLRFQPIARPLRQFRLDAVDLRIERVESSAPVQAWHYDDREITVTFAAPIPPEQEVSLTVAYSAQPSRGLYFRTPAMGYRPGDTHLFTQGEPIDARHWYPCPDAPNEKFTSEITCRVPEGMTVRSNGRLISEAKDPQTGLVAVRWLQDRPHVAYLVALTAGHFRKLEARYRDLPLAFFTPPSVFAHASNSFRGTTDMLAFFEAEIGVPYPWAKYDQVCVNDFVAGGMENTSLTILTDGTLFSEETETLRTSTDLVAHELAHQWFGDLVTCKDWSHLWLNEGFATYYEHLYSGHRHGCDAFLYDLYQSFRGFRDRADDTRPIVWRGFASPDEQFSYLAYPKGAWVLHMLRSQLGDELYRRCIRTFLERHRFGTVVTEDLNAVIEELSGRSFDQFFDQYVYHAHHPELAVTYAWDEPTRLAKLNLRQVQKLSDTVLLFRVPLTVRFRCGTNTFDRELLVARAEEDFYVALPEAPQRVRLDPDTALLAKIDFSPPHAMVLAQLTDATDLIGRLQAIELLARRKDADTVAHLKRVLNADAFHGVRIEAARALRSIHSDDARDALLASTAQSDARVRRAVHEALRAFYHPAVHAAARTALAAERNPDIAAQLLETLGAYPDPATRDTLLEYLGRDSFRHGLAEAAIAGLRSQDDPTTVAPLLEEVRTREAAFTSGGFARALSTLAFLARHQADRAPVREFLAAQVNHLKPSVRRAALAALGDLGDPRAIPVVEAFTRAGRDTPERQVAQKALADLRAFRKPSQELDDLRREVLTLQQENRDARKELDDLKKRLEALAPKPPTAPEKPPSAKRKTAAPTPRPRRS